ncbi:MAG: hypothetical protein ACXWZS_17985 [Gemmatirosa sp.]
MPLMRALVQAASGNDAGLVARLAEAAAPWQSLYSDSAVVSSAVLFAHLGALVIGGGMAIAADRATLRLGAPSSTDAEPLAAARARHALELRALHRPVLTALAMMLGSGVLLALADIEEFATSRVFWLKLALVVLLLANGARLARAERSINAVGHDAPVDAGWRALRAASIASLVLWIATVLAGVVLTNV